MYSNICSVHYALWWKFSQFQNSLLNLPLMLSFKLKTWMKNLFHQKYCIFRSCLAMLSMQKVTNISKLVVFDKCQRELRIANWKYLKVIFQARDVSKLDISLKNLTNSFLPVDSKLHSIAASIQPKFNIEKDEVRINIPHPAIFLPFPNNKRFSFGKRRIERRYSRLLV